MCHLVGHPKCMINCCEEVGKKQWLKSHHALIKKIKLGDGLDEIVRTPPSEAAVGEGSKLKRMTMYGLQETHTNFYDNYIKNREICRFKPKHANYGREITYSRDHKVEVLITSPHPPNDNPLGTLLAAASGQALENLEFFHAS